MVNNSSKDGRGRIRWEVDFDEVDILDSSDDSSDDEDTLAPDDRDMKVWLW